VGQAGAVEIVFARPKDLGFVLESAKGGGVEDPIAVDLERAAIILFGRGFLQALSIEGVVEVVSHGGLWG